MSRDLREEVARALTDLEIDNGEGGRYRLFELLDFSGENQTRIVIKAIADAALTAARPVIERETREADNQALSEYLKPGQTAIERIEQDHKDILGLMKLLQLEKEKVARLAKDVQDFVKHETTDAYRLRVGIANVRTMLRRSRAVSIVAKREIDAEMLRLLGADNGPEAAAIRSQP